MNLFILIAFFVEIPIAEAATVPSAPQNLSVSQDLTGSGLLDLSWTAPSSDGGSTITQYVIQRSTSSSSLSFTTVATVSGSPPTTSYTDTGLDTGKQYVYQIYAVNSIGNSPTSNISYGTTSEAPFLNLFGVFGNPSEKDCSTSAYSDCYQNGDTITLTFSDPTNQPDVSSKTSVDSILSFTDTSNNPIILGSSYHGTWVTPQVLVITIDDTSGTTLPSFSHVSAKVKSNSAFTNSQGTAQVSSTLSSNILSDFKHVPPPMIYSFVANDPHSRNTSYASGDTITIRFTEPTNQPDVSSETAIDKIFYFYDSFHGYKPNLGAHYKGTWTNAQTLQINITDASGTTTPPIVGVVNVTANAASLGTTVPILDSQSKSDSSAIIISLPLTGSFVSSLQSNQVAKAGKDVQVGLPSGLSTSIKLSNDGSIKVTNTTATVIQGKNQIKTFGNIVDITPSGNACSPSCNVSFLYSKEDLANLGISTNDVKIFHDSNNDGQIDESEVTSATVVEQSGIFNITATIPHFSKFAIGGIVVVNFIADVMGSSEPPSSFSGQHFLNLDSLSKDARDSMINEDPFTPLKPSNDPTVPYYPFSIDDKNYLVARYANTIDTVTVNTGIPVNLQFATYDKTVSHVELYTNMKGISKEIQDSDTYVIYDKNSPLKIVDPHGYFSNVKVNTSIVNNVEKTTFSVIFAKPLPKSNILVRDWDDQRYSSETKLLDAIEVKPSETTQTPTSNIQSQISPTNTEPIKPEEKPLQSNNLPANTLQDNTLFIKQWGGYDPTSISDSQLLVHFGIKANHIPNWYMKTSKFIVNGDTNEQDFKNAIDYLYQKGMIK